MTQARRPIGEEYCPTPDDIKDACKQIQQTWTEEERLRREPFGQGRVQYALASFGWAGESFSESHVPPVERTVSEETCLRMNQMMYSSGAIERIDIRRT